MRIALELGHRVALVAAVGILLVAGCSSVGPQSKSGNSGEPANGGTPKRVVAVAISEYPALISRFDRALPGAEAVEAAVASGLSIMDHHGVLGPVLAEAVPSIENGLWKLFPDGRMETTWHIRKNAVWHDGAPFTTDDILFTERVGREGVVPNFRPDGGDLIESIVASDLSTFTVRWTGPFINADELFNNDLSGVGILFPLPKHLLERPWLENKEGFTQLPYWSDDFVGTGPFKLKQFTRGVGLVLAAFDRFVLGRPKLDEIEVRFVADSNAAIANLLSGTADMTLGRLISIEQAADTAARWPQGHFDNTGLRSRLAFYPQFINPSPPIIANLSFRKALMYAMDRQTMADTLQNGLVPVANTYMGPDNPMYPQIEPLIVKYDYDPKKAAQMVEALGFARGADGSVSDASGQRLAVEARTTPGDLYNKILATVRDYWQAVGVTTETVQIPSQRQTDQEYRATRPGFELTRRGTDAPALHGFQGSQTPLPETRYFGNNIPRYQNAEFDALIERYFVTVPLGERTQVAGQIMRHISDQLNMMNIFYDSDPALISNRLVNVYGRGTVSAQTWNIYEWDVR